MNNQWRCWIPVLSVRDARASEKFYCDSLGFSSDWAHQFDIDFPLYISLSRDALTLHLSEHGGGGEKVTLVISVEDVDAVYAELCENGLQTDGPPEDRPYGTRDFGISDPDGHRLIISTPLADFRDAPGRKMNG